MSKTFSFGSKGHAMFMCSPSEIQKVYLSTVNGSSNLADMLSEFFDPRVVSPPAPKPNLFKSLFKSQDTLDREELFGENSGKPSTSIIKNVDGEVHKVKKELTELQKLALERGEKLSALQLKTEEMTMAASEFAKNAHSLANKYKNKGFFK
jgi:syntaxin-binding protein 5